MNSKFNLYSRSEEEKTADILLYEKKARAKEICDSYEKIKKKAESAEIAAVVLFSAIAFPIFYKFYDTESILGMILTVLCVIFLTVASRLAVGAVLARSLKAFVNWGRLSERWTYARKNMHELEEKFADQTVFEDDIRKAEEKLVAASDALIEFATEHNIN